MDARICKYASAFVLLASLGMGGCVKDGVSTDHVTAPSTLTPDPANVVTVEPGLYYQGMGGVRLEDVVIVTKTGCKNLVKIPKILEV